MRGAWRWSALSRESVLNTLNAHGKLWPLLACAVLGGTLIPVSEVRASDILRSDLHAEQMAGSGVVILSSQDPSSKPILAASCDALENDPGVLRAGTLDAVPGSDDVVQLGPYIPVVSASRSLFWEFGSATVLVGRQLDTHASDHLVRVLASRRFGSLDSTTVSLQPVGIDVNSALIVPRPPEDRWSSTCVVELSSRVQPAQMQPVLTAQLTTRGGMVTSRPAFNQKAKARDRWNGRPERYLPFLVAAGLAILAAALQFMRASEMATYRLAGSTRSDVWILGVFEMVVVSGTAAATGIVSSLLLEDLLADAGATALAVLWSAISAVWLFGFMSTGQLLRSEANLAKDR